MSPLPMYDLEGVLCGHAERKAGTRTLWYAVEGHGGIIGKRVFQLRAGWWEQDGPVQWDGRCARCGREESHPVHHGQDCEP